MTLIDNPLISDFIIAYTRADQDAQDARDSKEAMFSMLPGYLIEIRQANERMTQAQLAEALGVDHSSISKIENKQLRPSLDFALKLYKFVLLAD